MKKVIVIGAGISGLTAGIYARRSGFEVTLLEKTASPGGMITCWNRKGYTFEGGMHWLIGSTPRYEVHEIWKDTGALQANNPVHFKDPMYTLLEEDGTRLSLHRDLRELGEGPAARRLRRHVRRFEAVCLQPADVPGVRCLTPRKTNLKGVLKMIPAVLLYPWLVNISTERYLSRFKDGRVRNLLRSVVWPEYNALSFVYTLSTFTSGDSGYPAGGSLQMGRNMAGTLESLGGTIRYGTMVRCVRKTDDGRYEVQTDLGTETADAVIVSIDARTAIETLFGEPLQDRWARRLRKILHTAQCSLVSLGVRTDLSAYPETMQLLQKQPFEAASLSYDLLMVNNYARFGYAPQGCSTLTVLLRGKSFEYWKKAREDGTYKAKKQQLAQAVIRRLETFIPEIRGQVEAIDVATPATFQRYCNMHEGSYMTLWRAGDRPCRVPARFGQGLYFAGQRTSLCGGLPVAATTGRKAAMLLCKDFDTVFVER